MAKDYKDRASMPRKGGKSSGHTVRRSNKRTSPSRTSATSYNSKKTTQAKSARVKRDFKWPRLDIAEDMQHWVLVAAVIGFVVILFSYFLSSLSDSETTVEKPKSISRPLLAQPRNTTFQAAVEIKRKEISKPLPPPIKIVSKVIKPIRIKKLKPLNKAVSAKKAVPVLKKEIKYQFYSVLPDAEFIIPDYEVNTRKRQERIGHAKQGVEYMVQVAAFRSGADAENLRVQLLLMNFKANIEKIKVKSVTWHRVKLGPYQKMGTVSVLLSKLRNKGFDAIVSEVKK